MSKRMKVGLIIATVIVVSLMASTCSCFAPAPEEAPSPPVTMLIPATPPGFTDDQWVAAWNSWSQTQQQEYLTPFRVITQSPPASPRSVLTAAEQTYLTYLEGHALDMSYLTGQLGRLLEDAQIFDDDWIIEIALCMALIQLGYEEIQAEDCPSSMLHIHNKYVQGLSHLNTAMDLLAAGIDDFDVDSLDRGITETNIGTGLIEEAAQLKAEFLLEHE